MNQIAARALADLNLSEAQLDVLAKRAAAEFAKHGELGSILAQESLQAGRMNILRDAAAQRMATVTSGVAQTAQGVFSAADAGFDIYEMIQEFRQAQADPSHQFEHEGRAVGTVVGSVTGGALIAATAPVSLPLLLAGVAGAALIGWAAPNIFGWWGSQVDQARAEAARRRQRMK